MFIRGSFFGTLYYTYLSYFYHQLLYQVPGYSNLSYLSSLRSKVKLHGYNLYKLDDKLELSANYYQVNQNDEDNKITPIVMPHLEYYSGISEIKDNSINTKNIL